MRVTAPRIVEPALVVLFFLPSDLVSLVFTLPQHLRWRTSGLVDLSTALPLLRQTASKYSQVYVVFNINSTVRYFGSASITERVFVSFVSPEFGNI